MIISCYKPEACAATLTASNRSSIHPKMTFSAWYTVFRHTVPERRRFVLFCAILCYFVLLHRQNWGLSCQPNSHSSLTAHKPRKRRFPAGHIFLRHINYLPTHFGGAILDIAVCGSRRLWFGFDNKTAFSLRQLSVSVKRRTYRRISCFFFFFSRYIVRVVATVPSTTINWQSLLGGTNNGQTTLMNGQFIQIDTKYTNDLLVVKCSAKCLVMQYNKGIRLSMCILYKIFRWISQTCQFLHKRQLTRSFCAQKIFL